MKILPRKITSKISDALKVSPIVFVNGPRQAGKSTLVQALAKNMGSKDAPVEYLSFDKPVQMAAAVSEPEAFLTASDTLLIIDEVQMVPEIFRALKVVVDNLRSKRKSTANGRFLLTGSANIMALPELSDALVGRMSVMTLYPFCVAESLSAKGNAIDRMMDQDLSGLKDPGISLIDAIKLGTFPEISRMEVQEQSIWFDGYLTTILQRDVRMVAELEKISVLPALLRLLATRAGGLINDADIARSVGLNAVTGKVYRAILQAMFLTVDVPPWFKNLGKRLVKSSKGYLMDSLLLCHMLGTNLEDMRQKNPELYGHVVENFIATEILKQLTFSHTTARLFHFRTADGKEVDFVLEKPNGNIFGIEVKSSELVTADDFRGLNTLESMTKENFLGGVVLYSGKDVVPFGKKKWAVPFYILWQ